MCVAGEAVRPEELEQIGDQEKQETDKNMEEMWGVLKERGGRWVVCLFRHPQTCRGHVGGAQKAVGQVVCILGHVQVFQPYVGGPYWTVQFCVGDVGSSQSGWADIFGNLRQEEGRGALAVWVCQEV